MQKVRLETEDGAFVFDGMIPPFVTGAPKVVSWGERVFLLHSLGVTRPRIARLNREMSEAGDRRDASRCDEIATELEGIAPAPDEPVIYREVFWVAVLDPKLVLSGWGSIPSP